MATANLQSAQELPFSASPAHSGDGGHDNEAVSLHEYLTTTYHPDCDYIDGHLQERNLGEYDHARLQGEIFFVFRSHAAEWGIQTLPELRLQVSPANFRIPAVMVLRAGHKVDRIVREAPLLCIEVLSPEDTWKRLHEKVQDYLSLGVQHIWALDPGTREAYLCDDNGFHKVTTPDLTIPDTPIRLTLADVFPPA